ncbi:MAG: RNA methyltransferase [Candidatus Bathyarchaeota archaeon]|nr:RNA methyltransferase [Candidatus Bathyarchaeota archaeon]
MVNGNKKVTIAVPVSIISDVPHLREKTLKIGLIGRAAAIFRVNEIIVYPDNTKINQKRSRNLIATLLAYMETPQYLRKRLFKIKPDLKYAGILPPLRTPHHPIASHSSELKVGEHREGVILSVNEKGSIVDIGLERHALLENKFLQINKRVTVKITQLGKRPKAVLANKSEIEQYWGYTVTTSKTSFGNILQTQKYDLVVATSKIGTPINEVSDKLAKRWEKANKILVAFGAPSKGLQEIAAQEKLKLEDVSDFVVNTIPEQGTETVRTEEALYASLAILNTLVK